MSQRDLVAELRGARLAAPAHVREQVRLIAASATPPPRRFTWRRALVVALPVAAAVAAVVVVTRPAGRPAAQPEQSVVLRAQAQTATVAHGSIAAAPKALDRLAPAQNPNRAQRYEAYLALRVHSGDGVSNGVKRAQQIITSLGGYSLSVQAASESEAASADLTLKVPRVHVQEAITRLSALGTITGEQVEIQDVQAGLNATDRLIARLQRQVRDLRTQAQTDAVTRQIAAITARIERLQRQERATLRETHYATVQLHLATKSAASPKKHHHGPLHGLGVTFRWIGIGAVYALALGTPLLVVLLLLWLAARSIRRRREDALLSRA
jgi:Domain of unknown function (DUF4349)